MGKNDTNNPDPYRQQSVLVVPLPHPGVKIIRFTKIMGYDVGFLLFQPNIRMLLMVMQKLSSTMSAYQRETWFLEKDGDLRSFKVV
jgi:hypothetical protein